MSIGHQLFRGSRPTPSTMKQCTIPCSQAIKISLSKKQKKQLNMSQLHLAAIRRTVDFFEQKIDDNVLNDCLVNVL